ncbi:12266_t:CDS:2, partial [Funneliformis geosporum]
FGKGTPEFYKKLAYRCMNANSNQRPPTEELYQIDFCRSSLITVEENEAETILYDIFVEMKL